MAPWSAGRYDSRGVLRVHAPYLDVAELVSGVLDRMRWYAASSVEVFRARADEVARGLARV